MLTAVPLPPLGLPLDFRQRGNGCGLDGSGHRDNSVFRRGISTVIGNGATSPQFNKIDGLEGSQ